MSNKPRMIKRIAYSLIAAAMAPLFAWLIGYDFNERGVGAALTFSFTLFMGLMVYVCPLWDS